MNMMALPGLEGLDGNPSDSRHKSHNLTVKKVHYDRLMSLKKLKSVPKTEIDRMVSRYNLFVSEFVSAQVDKSPARQCSAISTYLDYAKELEAKYKALGHRSKYYSSIMEEVPVLMAEAYIKLHLSRITSPRPKSLLLGAGECVIRVVAGMDGNFVYDTKRMDFCFAVKNLDNAWIPLIGLEVKKYLDKTMMATVLDTYKSLKNFRARSFYGVLVENEARSKDTIENSEMFLSEFVLTDVQRSRVSPQNVFDPDKFIYFQDKLKREIWFAIEAISS